MDDADRCGYPRVKANVLAASASVWTQLTEVNGWTQPHKVSG